MILHRRGGGGTDPESAERRRSVLLRGERWVLTWTAGTGEVEITIRRAADLDGSDPERITIDRRPDRMKAREVEFLVERAAEGWFDPWNRPFPRVGRPLPHPDRSVLSNGIGYWFWWVERPVAFVGRQALALAGGHVRVRSTDGVDRSIGNPFGIRRRDHLRDRRVVRDGELLLVVPTG